MAGNQQAIDRIKLDGAVKQEYQISFADENDNIGLFFSEKTHWEKPEK